MASMFSTLLSGSHPGSWKIGPVTLPDFGFTEQAAKSLGAPTTSQGGSSFRSLLSQPQASSGGQTLGASNEPYTDAFMRTPPTSYSAPSGGGGGAASDWAKYHGNEGAMPTGYGGESGGGDMEGAAREQARVELEQAMSEYDRQADLGNQQIGSLETEQAGTLSDIETMRGRTKKEAETAVGEAETSTQKEKGKALSTAQDVQKTNRNVLRALGILSSSAAGEMLTKPMTQFGQQAAELGQQLVKRKSQVDDWLMQRNQDFDSEVGKVKNQYTTLINNIRTDLRYNGEQRALAVKAASAALQQKMGEIKQMSMQYQQAAREYNNNILSQIAQIQLYQNPNADVSGILSAMLNPGEQRQQGQTASIYQGEQKKKNTLSGY